MWRPTTYQDVARAVGELSEAADLDFKRDVSGPVKDVAAMSIEGGVIVVGVDEEAGQATALTLMEVRLSSAVHRMPAAVAGILVG